MLKKKKFNFYCFKYNKPRFEILCLINVLFMTMMMMVSDRNRNLIAFSELPLFLLLRGKISEYFYLIGS